jgi:DNA-binding transcriptional regulator YiaG
MTAIENTHTPWASGSGSQSSLSWQPLVFAALLPFQVGTGGMPNLDITHPRTGLTIVRQEPAARTPAQLIASSDRVLLIRRWLSLSVVDAARVFRVQRPTIYAWERGEFPAQKNLDRILTVFDLANHWRSISDEPVDALRKEPVTSEGRSLVDLLSERIVRPNAVKSAMASLGALQRKALAARPLSGAELAQRFGFQPLSPSATARNIAGEARGRVGWRGDKG